MLALSLAKDEAEGFNVARELKLYHGIKFQSGIGSKKGNVFKEFRAGIWQFLIFSKRSSVFTGIIKEIGKIVKITKKGSISRLELDSNIVVKSTQVSDSIAVNGVCLTVVAKNKTRLCFDVAASTLRDTNIKFFKKNEAVNLEPALEAGQKLGGHFVLGHIDSTLKIKRIIDKKGYWELELYLPRERTKFLVEKGSVAIDGISLTVKKILFDSFRLDVIPFTYQETNLKYKRPGSWLNVEFDYLLKKR